MKDDEDVRYHLTPLGRATLFRRGATKRLAEAAWQFSRALVWYWLYLRIESTRASKTVETTLLGLLGFLQQTKTAACDTPSVGEVETSNVELTGRGTES